MSRVFANGPGDPSSIPGRFMEHDASLINTQYYKVRIKGKVEQSTEWSSALPYTSVKKLLKRKPSGYPRLRSSALLFFTCYHVD